MSEMSYLEKLLDGVEVEWLPLGEVSALRRGRVMSKGYLTENFGPYPVYSSQTANNGKIGSINTFDFDGEYISWTTDGANAGTVFYRTGKFSITNVCGLITLKSKYSLIYKFLFYWLTIEAKKHVYSGMGNPKLMSHQVENIPVPIPCPDNPEKSLAIQSEIVRILDKFTALTAELTAELNMRKKQYNYYRDQLLSFKDGEVEWKTLGEIGDFTYGYAAKAMDSGDARFVRITDINKDGKLSKENPMYVELNEENEKYTLDKNDLLMARTGATFGKTMIFEEDYPAVYAGFLIKLNLNKTIINAKYYWHFAQSDFFWEQANKLVSGGGQPQFNANALKQVRVPIPYPSHPQKSLDEQGRIVDILDKFDAIAASITEGLPREIELRQKQYEYYRDLLFSFPKPETASN
ncbi:TPA: restriction endonuclease subunit S [Escherichia coli]|nr:restriction endonuclease subunit S [Escherichia coli]HDQ0116873.1 restriction endonuclease subunit S [Escherichia coli]